MADVVRQAGGDAADIQNLDAALRPVERYAVRFLLDNVLPALDMVDVEARLQEQLQVEDLDVDAVEALEAEEEEEVCWVGVVNGGGGDSTYQVIPSIA